MPDNPRKILVAPLNWGLGHATRCIPVIRALQDNGFLPLLASDGAALKLLQAEFPELTAFELPSYDISYPENGDDFKWKMLQKTPRILKAMLDEKKMVRQLVREHQIQGIISDNRLGVQSKKVASVFMTHQLKVLSGKTTWLSTKLHRKIIEQFMECWVPDFAHGPNLSGKLGHPKKSVQAIQYIGPLSRFERAQADHKYDLMVLLSGPEPQRTMLEAELLEELQRYNGTIVFVGGKIEDRQRREQIGRIQYHNFLTSAALNDALNESKMVLCRSGYTTIMDLAKLGKKAFFIPTPGQPEQEYLAKKFRKDGVAPFSDQADFTCEKLAEADLYRGFRGYSQEMHWKQLFSLFESE